MFPADSLTGIHYEERRVADAKRVADLREQQEKAALQNAQRLPASHHARQGSLAQAMQKQGGARAGVLNGIFQGLAKSASGASTPALAHFNSRTSTPNMTPLHSPDKTPSAAAIEAALIAEKKRDADICAMPAWYH